MAPVRQRPILKRIEYALRWRYVKYVKKHNPQKFQAMWLDRLSRDMGAEIEWTVREVRKEVHG